MSTRHPRQAPIPCCTGDPRRADPSRTAHRRHASRDLSGLPSMARLWRIRRRSDPFTPIPAPGLTRTFSSDQFSERRTEGVRDAEAGGSNPPFSTRESAGRKAASLDVTAAPEESLVSAAVGSAQPHYVNHSTLLLLLVDAHPQPAFPNLGPNSSPSMNRRRASTGTRRLLKRSCEESVIKPE